MERTNLRGEKGAKPPETNGLNFPMVWLRPGGKKPAQEAPREPPEGGSPQGQPADNGAAESNANGDKAGNEGARYIDCSRFIGRNQLPIKLEFKIPRNAQVFNCAATHKEWFALLLKLDPTARIITYREAAISDLNSFPKNQAEYNRCFPQRITRQPGQPRAAEIVFEIETAENFQSIKTYNKEMMDFLNRKGVFMKMNLASQLRRGSLGFFTHIHPKAAWREDLQEKILAALRANMTIQ